MEIFYTTIDSFSKEKEHKEARKLLAYVLKNYYNIKNFEIEYKNKKPILKDNSICFNISHTNGVVIIGFDKNPIGVDIEYMKQRDFSKFEKRYKKKFDKNSFYTFWTQYEAKIKLQNDKCFIKTFELKDNYKMSIASLHEISRLKIYEIKNKNFI